MRWRRRILIGLIGGVAATLVVSWSCALWSSETAYTRWDSIMHDRQPPPSWPADVPAEWLIEPHPDHPGLLRADYVDISGFGFGRGKCAVGRVYGGSGTVFQHWVVYWRAGWPLKSLQCEGRLDRPGPRTGMRGGLPTPAWLSPIHREGLWDMVMDGDFLPLVPMWPGFLVDAALYGAATVLLVSGFASARRAVWRRAGRCASCGYDRSSLASLESPCPECGTVPGPASN
jgi:hypothetical protein